MPTTTVTAQTQRTNRPPCLVNISFNSFCDASGTNAVENKSLQGACQGAAKVSQSVKTCARRSGCRDALHRNNVLMVYGTTGFIVDGQCSTPRDDARSQARNGDASVVVDGGGNISAP